MRSAEEIIEALSRANAAEISRVTGIKQNHLYKLKGTAARGLKYNEGVALAQALWPKVDQNDDSATENFNGLETFDLVAALLDPLLEVSKIQLVDRGLLIEVALSTLRALQSDPEAIDDLPAEARRLVRAFFFGLPRSKHAQ